MVRASTRRRSGQVLNGVYELHELIEQSADCESYRAIDRSRGCSVRLRILTEDKVFAPGAVERFLRVPKSLHALAHPNVSQVFAIESDDSGIPFVVEELDSGDRLDSTVQSFPQGMPLGVAITLLIPVVEAVAAAHRAGLVHGNIDGGNVLLAHTGTGSVPKLTGFEQTQPGGDPRGDVRALGALLYRALSGESAGGRTHTPLEELAPHLPAELLEVVERCLSKDARKQPRDAVEVRDALAGTLAQLRGPERRSLPGRSSPPPRAQASQPQRAPARPQPSAPVRPPSAPIRAPSAPLRSQPAKPLRQPSAPLRPQASAPVPPRTSAPARPAKAAPAAQPKPVAEAQPDLDDVFAATFGEDTHDAPAPAAAQTPQSPLGFAATMVAQSSDVRSEDEQASYARSFSSRPPATRTIRDSTPAPPFAATVDDEEPELTLEPAAAPRPSPLATISDLAAAFAPIEGSEERIQQHEAETSSRGRSFRKAFEEAEAEAASTRALRRRPGMASERPPAGPVPSSPPTQARPEARSKAPVALTDAQLRALRVSTEEEESRSRRALFALLFFFFVIALAPGTALLCRRNASKLAELPAQPKLIVVGVTVLAIVALVRTWTLQITQRPVLLKPVTITLQVVTTLVCVLTATFFLPDGALGPIEAGARVLLPWTSGMFYVFLAFYGLAQAVRNAGNNALTALAQGLLYSGAFFGAYSVLAMTVLGDAQSQHAKLASVTNLAGMVMPDPSQQQSVRSDESDAGTVEEVQQRSVIGASEVDDMRAVEQLEDSRKRSGQRVQERGAALKKILQ